MLIRRLVIASLIAGAASAHAGNITAPAAQPSNVITGWTAGNGTDVLGSGVLQGDLSLVAGVAHTADASLSNILYGKASGSSQQVDGQTKLVFERGIEANYLLASGNGILAATAGVGKTVVNAVDGVIISDGKAKAPDMIGGGNNTAGNGGSGSSNSGGGMTNPPESSQGNNPADTSGQIPGKGAGIGVDIDFGIGEGTGSGGLNGNGDSLGNIGDNESAATEVPEPSSIALMLLGMMGAGAISRRRSR